jgi:Flp pilus assembly protein protease CpaA
MYFDIIRLALLSIVIGYAAYSDHKTGEVANKVWIYAPFGLSLTFIQLAIDPVQFLPAILSFVATVVISLTLFYVGGWGGADAKAFLTIGASMPITPIHGATSLSFMYPLNVILICSITAFIASLAIAVKRKAKTQNYKQFFVAWIKNSQVRFVPYILIAMYLAVLV